MSSKFLSNCTLYECATMKSHFSIIFFPLIFCIPYMKCAMNISKSCKLYMCSSLSKISSRTIAFTKRLSTYFFFYTHLKSVSLMSSVIKLLCLEKISLSILTIHVKSFTYSLVITVMHLGF